MKFSNKVTLVTGATSGIGYEIAKQLLIRGSMVIINYGHDDDKMEETRKKLDEYKENILFVKADISIKKEVEAMFQIIKSRYGRLDFLINNAGTNINGWLEDLKSKDWEMVINTNLTGKFLCTRYAIALLKKGNSPAIVNISSRLGTKPCMGSSANCCAEAAIIMLTKTSALELSKYNIRVNTVSPSLTMTPLVIQGWSKEEIEQAKIDNPSHRLGETIDIANTVLFLLSAEASYINGENINVNGGLLLK